MVTEESSEHKLPTVSMAATSFGSPEGIPNTYLSLDNVERDLLSDPSLVDNYADILKIRPLAHGANSSRGDTDNESESASGSVVVMPKSASLSPLKQRSSLVSNTSSRYSIGADRECVSKDEDGVESTKVRDYLEGVESENKAQELAEQGKENSQGASELAVHEDQSKLGSYIDRDGDSDTNLHNNAQDEDNDDDNEHKHEQNDRLDIDSNELDHGDLKKTLSVDGTGFSQSSQSSQDYGYSDSDFEDNMEKRLQNLSASPSSLERSESKKSAHDGESDDGFDGFDLASSSEEEEGDNGIEEYEQKDEKQGNEEVFKQESDDNDRDEDEENEIYGYGPQYPPKELDPEKLYALHPFFGPDPSHCQLEQDESCLLLNDQDSYWWLVKRYSDNKIGFAPAELLETFPERLARLNCWKNENMSSQSFSSQRAGSDSLQSNEHPKTTEIKEHIEEHLNEKIEGDRSRVLKEYIKGNKSVSFNDVVGYANRYIGNEIEDDEVVDPKPRDEFTEVDMSFNGQQEDDDASEVVSDVCFDVASMPLLDIKKVRRPQNKEGVPKENKYEGQTDTDDSVSYDKVEDAEEDALRKIFEAPVVPFVKNSSRTGANMANSYSDYSISTIGEFSPSSSEWTNDSPQLTNDKFQDDSAVIPPSRAIQDFSKFVGTDSDKNDTSNKISKETLDQASDGTISATRKNGSAKAAHNNKSSISVLSSSSSSEEFLMDSERVASSTSVNSTSSVSRQISNPKRSTEISGEACHPYVQQLYNPLLLKMDDLMRQLDEIVNKS